MDGVRRDMGPVRTLIAAAVALMLGAGAAEAASVLVTYRDAEGHHAGVEITGAITPSVVEAFAREVAFLRPRFEIIHVELDSPGGNVDSAMKLGTIARENSLWVGVSKPGAQCLSACVLALAGGVYRPVIDPIAIHRPQLANEHFAGLDAAEAHRHYEELMAGVGRYLQEMGIDERLFAAMLQVPADKLRFLTPAEIEQWGLSRPTPVYQDWQRQAAQRGR